MSGQDKKVKDRALIFVRVTRKEEPARETDKDQLDGGGEGTGSQRRGECPIGTWSWVSSAAESPGCCCGPWGITSELVRGLHAEWGTEEWLSMQRARVGCPPENSGHGKKRRTEAQRRDLVAAGLVCFRRTWFIAER